METDEFETAKAGIDFPAALYRYMSVGSEPRIGWARSLLRDRQLYFARPSELNDPFDCQIEFSFDGDPNDVRRYWQDYVRRHGVQDVNNTVERFVHLSRTNQGCERLTEMHRRAFDENTGVACFAESPLNIQMWSYYGDAHKGVAVEFAFAKGPVRVQRPPVIFRVEYHSSYPTLNYYRDAKTRMQAMLSTKAVGWSHEAEWRVVLAGDGGPKELSPNGITGVVFGLRTPRDTESLVREWLRGRAVTFKRVIAAPRSFELRLVPA